MEAQVAPETSEPVCDCIQQRCFTKGTTWPNPKTRVRFVLTFADVPFSFVKCYVRTGLIPVTQFIVRTTADAENTMLLLASALLYQRFLGGDEPSMISTLYNS